MRDEVLVGAVVDGEATRLPKGPSDAHPLPQWSQGVGEFAKWPNFFRKS